MGHARMFVPIAYELELTGESLTLLRLQRGRYQVTLTDEQGNFWMSEVIALGARPVSVACGPLQPIETLRPSP